MTQYTDNFDEWNKSLNDENYTDMQEKEKPSQLVDGCQYCGREFDTIKFRYLCPYCKMKNTCCE